MNKPQDYTPTQIAQLLDGFTELKSWINAVEEYALQQVQDGQEIPGYSLGMTRSTRVWVDESQVITALLDANRELDEICPRELLSVAKMEKLLKKDFGNINDLVGSKQGNPKIVRSKITE